MNWLTKAIKFGEKIKKVLRKRPSKEDIAKVATLPSLEEIRGKIVGLINAPASKLVRLLQRPDQDIISILQNKKD